MFPPFARKGLLYPGQLLVVSETGIGQRSQVSYIISRGDTLYAICIRFSPVPEMLVGLRPSSGRVITEERTIITSAGVPTYGSYSTCIRFDR